MRILFSFLLLFFFLGLPIASAQQNAAPNQNSAQKPAGFDNFFEELGKVMKNYPEAAKRFGIYDSLSVRKAVCSAGQTACCKEFCVGWPTWCSSCVTEGCCDILK